MRISIKSACGSAALAIGVLAAGSALGNAERPSGEESLVATAISPLRFEPVSDGVDLLPSLSSAGVVSLQESDPAKDAPVAAHSDWHFTLDATFWLPIRTTGRLGIGAASTTFDTTLEEVLDNLDLILEGGFTFTNDEWSLIFWGLYLDVSDEASTETMSGPASASLDMKTTMLDVAVARRIDEWPLGDSATATWSLDLLAGFRYWNLDVEITAAGPPGFARIRKSTHWFDPLVGGLLTFDISEKWRATFRADVGGFGIGSAADVTWRLELLGYYAVSSNVDLVLGWRHLHFDRDPSSKLDYDVTMYGPMVGATIRF